MKIPKGYSYTKRFTSKWFLFWISFIINRAWGTQNNRQI